MMMTAPPPPPIPYPTKSKLKSSFYPYSSYSSPAKFSPSAPDKLDGGGGRYKKKDSFFSKPGGGGKGGKGGLYGDPWKDASLFGSDLGPFMGAHKDSWSEIDIGTPPPSLSESMSDTSPPSILGTGSVDLFGGYGTAMARDKDADSDPASVPPSSSLFGSGTGTFGSMGAVSEGNTAPSSIFGTSISPGSFGSIGGMGQYKQTSSPTSVFGSTGSPDKTSSIWAPYSKLRPPPPPPPANAPSPIDYSCSPLSEPSYGGAVASPLSLFGSLIGKKGRTKTKPSSPDSIAIAYTPSSALPAERLSSSETAARPLSLRTRALIDLQTYEGCFELDSTLAPLVGVSITNLEAKLATCMVFSGSNAKRLSEEQKRKVWATVFAIKVFETQLVGERSVWGMVVDKARAWMRAMVGDEDVNVLEKLVGEVLGI